MTEKGSGIDALSESLREACAVDATLKQLNASEIDSIIAALVEHRFSETRKAAQQQLEKVLNAAANRLHEEAKNAT